MGDDVYIENSNLNFSVVVVSAPDKNSVIAIASNVIEKIEEVYLPFWCLLNKRLNFV